MRFGQQPTPDGGSVLLGREGEAWLETPFLTFPFEDMRTTSLIGLDTATGEESVLHVAERADVSSVLRHRTTGRVLAAASTYFRTVWQALEADVARDLAALRNAVEGDFAVVSQSADTRLWVMSCKSG